MFGNREKPKREGEVLTPQERAVIDLLGEAFNAFVALPREHPSELREFEQAIHVAQTLVMARPTARAEGWVKRSDVPPAPPDSPGYTLVSQI
jgi:hypothetical protein